jgi:probable 2-oxoglutarate dehydrogenase E1 component DHKTD1
VFGKHYYALKAEQLKQNLNDVAIVRVEEMSPFPAHELRQVLNEYKNAKEFVWAQEEHRNMGAWFFVAPRFEQILGVKLRYFGREVHNTIVGTGSLHAKEVRGILSRPFEKF